MGCQLQLLLHSSQVNPPGHVPQSWGKLVSPGVHPWPPQPPALDHPLQLPHWQLPEHVRARV